MSSFNPYVCMQTNSKCYKNTFKMKPVGVLWHSTGANNPNLKRYVQPANGSANYGVDIAKLGKNTNNNDYNHISLNSGLNAFIGKFADGSVGTVQTMPWDYAPWGCGSGSKGSCNYKQLSDKSYVGWIQFEICEDNLADKGYAEKVYNEAVKLTTYLCEMYGLDPNGTYTINGVKIPVITCHNDASKLGFATSHADINHWFPKLLGKDMSDVREEVTKMLGSAASSSYSKEWINGYWYNEDGSQTYEYKGDWKKDEIGWWFEDESGWYPKNEWQKINSKWYYFKEDGYMAESQWIDGYWVDENGAYDASKKQSSTYNVKVTAKALNVRKSPSKNAGVNKIVYQGATLTIEKTQGEWSCLTSNQGWVMTKFVQKV